LFLYIIAKYIIVLFYDVRLSHLNKDYFLVTYLLTYLVTYSRRIVLAF